MRRRSFGTRFGALLANGSPQASQPESRPCEFKTQYREANRNNYDCRAGCHNHDNSDEQHSDSDHRNRNSASGIERQMQRFFDHLLLPNDPRLLPRQVVDDEPISAIELCFR